MKIDPKRDYKKPLYAIGATALIGVTMLSTACGSDPQISGEMTTVESRDVELMGETTVDTDYVELDGDVDVCDPTEETIEDAKVEKNGN